MCNSDEPFQLRKRFRFDEDDQFNQRAQPWQKHIIDLENGMYLGRTPMRWLYLVFFYVIFYGALILMWAVCYLAFDGAMQYQRPKWLLKQPGFSFEPSLDTAEFDFKIEYHQLKEDEVSRYVNHLEMSLSKYGLVPNNHFGPCSSDHDFGYKDGQPCIFLKVNRILGFQPQCIERPIELPLEAPLELYTYMASLAEAERRDRIWISCQSRPTLAIEFYPQRYFDARLMHATKVVQHNASDEYIDIYGRENSKFYSAHDFQRIIAVQLLNVEPNIEYKVVCLLWAKNINRDIRGKMGHGLVRFSLWLGHDKE